MLEAQNVSLQYGKRVLFDEVNIKFHGDNCYGVIGANGAGKSTLINQILYPALAAELNKSQMMVGKHDSIKGLSHLNKIINIDQKPIKVEGLDIMPEINQTLDKIKTFSHQVISGAFKGFSGKQY